MRTLGCWPVTLRGVFLLIAALSAAKVVVFLTVYYSSHWIVVYDAQIGYDHSIASALRTLSTDWDGLQYQLIAQLGYSNFKGAESYAFSPVYPALIYLGSLATGSYWTSALLVTNVVSCAYPIVLLRLFGFRTALVAELFPVYVVYGMIGYSDVIALTLLSLSLLFFVRGRYLLTGIFVALAGLVFYDLLIAAIPFGAYLLLRRGRASLAEVRALRPALSVLLPPLAAGLAILGAYLASTGDAFTFFKLERMYWAVAPTNPLGQIQWVFDGRGAGSFNGITWHVYGLALDAAYWVVRNAIFEGFFFLGVLLLVRMKALAHKWPLVGYSLVVSIPLLFVQGTPVYSIPRLLLAGFPIFLAYSERVFARRLALAAYVVGSFVVACWVLATFAFGFFA